jgi:hypothetical protein
MDVFVNDGALSVAQAVPDARAAFVRRTYLHLAGAVAAFVGLEFLLLNSPVAPAMLKFISGNQYGWLLFLGAFIVAGWAGRSLASNVKSPAAQYAGLAAYVAAEALIFVPLLYVAARYSSPDVLPSAAILTGTLFLGLTIVAFATRRDFSFLRGILGVGGMVALGLIVCGVLFGFGLGLWFSFAMVGLACAAILYDTSKVIHQFRTDQHVAAALELFASVALLFWYVLSILLRMSRK